MTSNPNEPAWADRIRKVAHRFGTFADSVLAHPEPYPWDLWGADSDDLMIEAGRVLVKAIEAGAMKVEGIGQYPSYIRARADGNDAFAELADVFERVLWILGLDPDDTPSAYDAHLRTWKADDPQRERLEARAFAEVQRKRGEALAAVAAKAEPIRPLARPHPTLAASPETIDAVRTVLADWDGVNWSAARQVLSNAGRTDSDLDRMNEHEVRMAFAVGQRPLMLAIGGQANTATHSIQAFNPGGAAAPAEQGSGPAAAKPSHSADFTFVDWWGTQYTFALGVQSAAVKALWGEWEKTGLGLHQDTIREAVDAERDNFRMDKTFRDHPAFGTMIQNAGDGRYQLAPPKSGTAAPDPKTKKSAGIPAKARQRPR